jgi:hypothetical protein
MIMAEAPTEIAVTHILAAFGAISLVLIPIIISTAISRMQRYREIIVCLKRELNRHEGGDSWEDGPDSERPPKG